MKETQMLNKAKNVVLPTIGISFLILGISASVFTFSWFTNRNYISNTDITGATAGAYFARGTGKSDDPYILNKPIHLYNLAWLQYMGIFNEPDSSSSSNESDGTISATYFKLDDNLDMSGYTLPPIGTEDYPFVSNFDGGEYIVSNLTVSSEYSDYSRHPGAVTASNYNAPKIIGFFGVIGSLNTSGEIETTDDKGNNVTYTYDTSTNSVSNLYLDQVVIQNGSNSTRVLAGLLAGYVNGTLTTSGVYRGKFNFENGTTSINETINTKSITNVSNYSLVGAYNSNEYSWTNEPGNGAGTNYGTSTNIKQIYSDLGGTDGSEVGKNYAYPFRRENNTLIDCGGETVSANVYGGTYKTLTKSSTYKASTKGNNIGYYAGSGIKAYYKSNVTYDVSDFNTSSQSGNGSSLTNAFLKKPTDDVLEYLNKNGNYLLRLTGNYKDIVTLNNSTDYSISVLGSNFSYVPNSQVGNWTGNLIIPSRCIWVAPEKEGSFKFVYYNPDYETSNTCIMLMMLERTSRGSYGGPFYYYVNIWAITYTGKFGYVELNSSSSNYEYAIAFYNTGSNKAPYIAYLDIGATGSDEDDMNPALITDIDFVSATNDNISNGLIKITDSAYTKSNILFSISGTSDEQTFYFMRLISNGVLYYVNGSGLTLTPIGTGDNSNSDKSNWDETSN